MASPRSSADEGEIVESRRATASSKANTFTRAAPPVIAAAQSDVVDGFHVDRRNRNARARVSRSPELDRSRPRNVSPRGLKRQRDGLRDGPRDGPRDDRDAWRRNADGPRYFDGAHDGRRGDRDFDRPRDGGARNDRWRERMYDDTTSGGGRDDDRSCTTGQHYGPSKRPRTRSRSPPPVQRNRGRGGGGGGRGRDRDWDRNGEYDRSRDQGQERDRDRGWGRDRRENGDGRDGGRWRQNGNQDKAESRQGKDGRDRLHNDSDVAKSAQGASSQLPPQEEPMPEDWVEQTPVDEEAEIQRRRQRRQEILKKAHTASPMLALAVSADKATAAAVAVTVESPMQVDNSPKTDANTPRSVEATITSPTSPDGSGAVRSRSGTEGLDLADDGAFLAALGKHGVNGAAGAEGIAPDNEDGPSAADYDPTADMAEDERRDELRNGGMVAGLHGAERRASLSTAAAEKERLQFQQQHGDTEMKESVEAAAASGDDEKASKGNHKDGHGDDDEDEDDMFAEDFVEKKYVAPQAAAADAANAANVANAPDAAAAVAAMAAGGGALLDGDDHQGYYKIRPGEVLDGRYQIQSALGKGMFSGVARAWDISSQTRRLVAIKIMRNNDALRKGGYTEIAILQKLNGEDPENRRHIVRFERAFDFRGHLCMVFENLSMNLREVLKKFGNNVGINLHGVRVYAHQIFVGLAHMRRASIIHADLKPDNILVNETRSIVKICDLGTAIDRSDAVTAHTEITPYLVSRFYRAPEIILGMPYDYGVDMWSIGCTLYELYTGKILFAGADNNQMLRAIMEVRGKISSKLYRRGEMWSLHFDELGNFFSKEHDKFQDKTTIKTLTITRPTRDLRTRLLAASAGMDDAETKDLHHFYDLLDRCLNLNPDKRITPGDALKHPFFTSGRAR